jgi:hypothetical protein
MKHPVGSWGEEREADMLKHTRRTRDVRRGLSYANVMATLAVFGVLAGGGAYAASEIAPKSGASARSVGKVTEVRKDKSISNEQANVVAKCPQGKRVVSGGSGSGISDTAANSDVQILESHRSGNGWLVIGVTQTGPRTIHAYAYCVSKTN